MTRSLSQRLARHRPAVSAVLAGLLGFVATTAAAQTPTPLPPPTVEPPVLEVPPASRTPLEIPGTSRSPYAPAPAPSYTPQQYTPQPPVAEQPYATPGLSLGAELGAERLPPPVPLQPLPSVASPPVILLPEAPPTIDDFSWILIEKPRPRPIRVHDIITITVDDKNEVFVDNRFNRSRIGQIKAELKEFIRLGEGRLLNAAANSPTVDANLQSRLNSQGQIQASEGIKSIVAARVVDIQPNGNLVLEARKHVRTNRDTWEYRLTGIIRPEKITRDFTAVSEDLADLKIEKTQGGKVHQSTKRAWGVVLYDWLSPF